MVSRSLCALLIFFGGSVHAFGIKEVFGNKVKRVSSEPRRITMLEDHCPEDLDAIRAVFNGKGCFNFPFTFNNETFSSEFDGYCDLCDWGGAYLLFLEMPKDCLVRANWTDDGEGTDSFTWDIYSDIVREYGLEAAINAFGTPIQTYMGFDYFLPLWGAICAKPGDTFCGKRLIETLFFEEEDVILDAMCNSTECFESFAFTLPDAEKKKKGDCFQEMDMLQAMCLEENGFKCYDKLQYVLDEDTNITNVENQDFCNSTCGRAILTVMETMTKDTDCYEGQEIPLYLLGVCTRDQAGAFCFPQVQGYTIDLPAAKGACDDGPPSNWTSCKESCKTQTRQIIEDLGCCGDFWVIMNFGEPGARPGLEWGRDVCELDGEFDREKKDCEVFPTLEDQLDDAFEEIEEGIEEVGKGGPPDGKGKPGAPPPGNGTTNSTGPFSPANRLKESTTVLASLMFLAFWL